MNLTFRSENKRIYRAISLMICIVLISFLCGCGGSVSGSETKSETVSKSMSDVKSGSESGRETNSDSDTVFDGGDEPLQGYAVSSCSEYATDAAVQVLEAGGNAVDAAVALAYTLAVVEPSSSGLGGGGCMLIYSPDTDQYYFYNYAAEAPSSGVSKTILVPGFVSGLDAVLSDLGTMSLGELIEPAIAYCDGFTINKTLAEKIDNASASLISNSSFAPNGNLLGEGDTLVQPELKEVLMILRQEGASAFYTGQIAERIAAETSLTTYDLAAYETIKGNPVIGNCFGYTLAAAAAPFSGVTVIQMLEMAEAMDMASPEADPGSFLSQLRQITIASLSDRIKNVFDYRFGEPNYTQAQTVSSEYINELLNMELSADISDEESMDTTAFTVIDKNGMVVVCTNTLGNFFGSEVCVNGFFMNASGANFGTGVNAYAAGKRPRTYISPIILRSDDEVIAAATPGGQVIVRVLSEVLLDIVKFGTSPEEAIAKQRVIFISNDLIYYEVGYDTELLVDISESKYAAIPYNSHSYFGNLAYSSCSSSEGFFACTDIRREGKGVYYNEWAYDDE